MRKLAVFLVFGAIVGTAAFKLAEEARMKAFDQTIDTICKTAGQRLEAALADREQTKALYDYLGGEALDQLKALPQPNLPYRAAAINRLGNLCDQASKAYAADPLMGSSKEALESVGMEIIGVLDNFRAGRVDERDIW